MALTFETSWDQGFSIKEGSEEERQAFWESLSEEERYWATAANTLKDCGYRISDEKLALAATWRALRSGQSVMAEID